MPASCLKASRALARQMSMPRRARRDRSSTSGFLHKHFGPNAEDDDNDDEDGEDDEDEDEDVD